MQIDLVSPPRTFRVGPRQDIELKDCARIVLGADEQVTFTTAAGGEYDVARKSWGFYATPSLNDRLPRFGLRPALVRDAAGKAFVMLVERGCEAEFSVYLGAQQLRLSAWLDDARVLDGIERGVEG